MKSRVAFFLIFLSVLLLTQTAISGTWTDTRSTNTFSITGTTVSTSTQQGGHGTTYYRVSGNADISGNAYPLGDDDTYEATMWLEASGKDSSSVPDRSNIDKNKKSGGIYRDKYRSATGVVLYKRHNVAHTHTVVVVPGIYKANSLSDSVSSPTYVKGSYSSPTGLSASPYCYGSLSGSVRKSTGGSSPTTLTFRSGSNTSTGDSPDDGSEQIVAEICSRKDHCQKPFTATTSISHRMECPEQRWGTNIALEAVNLHNTFLSKIFKKPKEDCPGYVWTCSPLACDFTASHVPASELHLEEKYVDANGTPVDPNKEKRPCGHLLSASGDHSLQASCSTDSNCIATNFYQCQHTEHEYAKKELLACGIHAVGTPGYHDKIYCGFCRAPTYACLRDDGHGPVRCPKDSDGQTCTVDEGWQIACADPPHVCKYPSDTQPQPVVTPPKETPPTTPQPKATLQACGHVYDPGSSSAYSHRKLTCPTQNGRVCSNGPTYYVCKERLNDLQSYPLKETRKKMLKKDCRFDKVILPEMSSLY